MSTHKICSGREIKKIVFQYTLLSGGLIRVNQVNILVVFIPFLNQGHNLCKLKYISLEEVNIVQFQQLFQSEATESHLFRLCLIFFRPRSKWQAQKYNLFKLESRFFLIFNDLAYTFLYHPNQL